MDDLCVFCDKEHDPAVDPCAEFLAYRESAASYEWKAVDVTVTVSGAPSAWDKWLIEDAAIKRFRMELNVRKKLFG